jgi:two-component system NtrC family sensor kinase
VPAAFRSGHLEQAEVELVAPDGARNWFQVTAAPLRNETGEIQEVIVLSHDVTRRRLLEQQLLWSDKLSAVGELIAGVAHELNNPLAAVLGFSELLLQTEVPE